MAISGRPNLNLYILCKYMGSKITNKFTHYYKLSPKHIIENNTKRSIVHAEQLASQYDTELTSNNSKR